MKLYTFLLLSIFAVWTSVGFAQTSTEESHRLIIRGNKDFPPYEFINDNGEPDGLNVELTRALMEELKMEYDLKLDLWAKVITEFDAGKADLVTGLLKSDERMSKFYFSEPNCLVHYNIICRKEAPVRNIDNLKGKRIIIQHNTLSQEILRNTNYADTLIIVDELRDGLVRLSHGEGDAMVSPGSTVSYILHKSNLPNLCVTNVVGSSRECCLASNDHALTEKIDAALQVLHRNGTYDRIRTKWLGEEDRAFHIPWWIYLILGGLSLSGIVLFISRQFYRHHFLRGQQLLCQENIKLKAAVDEKNNLLKKYQTIFNKTLAGLTYYDRDGILVEINDTMMGYFGITDKQLCISKPLSIYDNPVLKENGIVTPDGRIEQFHGVLKYDLCKGHCPSYFSNANPCGEIKYLKISVIPIVDVDGSFGGALLTAIDQTLEVNHNAKIEQAQAQLDLALEAGEVSAWIYYPKRRWFATLSGNALAGAGISLEDNLKMLHPDDRETQLAALDSLIRGEQQRAEEVFRYPSDDGSYHYYESRMMVSFENGEATAILGTQKDITNAMEHEKQAEEYRLRFELAIEAGGLKPWIYDIEKNIFLNLQADGNEIPPQGLSLEERCAMIYAPDRNAYRQFISAILDGSRNKDVAIFRFHLPDDEEQFTYNEVRMLAVTNKDGKISHIIGTKKDVTRQTVSGKKLSDGIEQLRFAIQTADMTMWKYNPATRLFTVYNEPIVGNIDGSQLSMANYLHCFAPEDIASEQFSNVENIMRNGFDESYSIDMRVRIPGDTEWQYCTIRGVPFDHDETGRVTTYLGIRQNNTKMILYQKQLETEREHAMQADKLKSAFLANMSHEIRTPLNAIVGFSDLLQTTDDPHERAEFANIINANNELLLRLIGDILDLSKIEAGFIELNPKSFDLSNVFDDIYLTSKQRNTTPDIEFIGLNPYKHCIVTLDKNRVVQVGMNFMTNAIKHTRHGSITIGYEYVDHGIRLFVEDTGTGIPKDKQSKLFERFAKLDDFSQGTGLGLAICKAIIDIMGGKIGAESEEGKGSMFWAWIPCEAEIEEN